MLTSTAHADLPVVILQILPKRLKPLVLILPSCPFSILAFEELPFSRTIFVSLLSVRDIGTHNCARFFQNALIYIC